MAFIIVGPVIYYEPILRAFMQKLLQTLKDDGAKWLEGRSLSSAPFTPKGSGSYTRGTMELCGVLNEEIEKFISSEDGKGFCGARFIWTSMRGQESSTLIDGRV